MEEGEGCAAALSAETEIDITLSPSEKDLVWSVDISIMVRKYIRICRKYFHIDSQDQ